MKFDCSLKGVGEFLLKFADTLNIGSFDLMGTSHGGGVAIMAAAADVRAHGLAERRVRKLMLVAPVNPWSWGRPWLVRIFTSAAGRVCSRAAFLVLHRWHRWLLGRMYGDPRRMEPGASSAYAAHCAIPGTLPHLMNVLRCWRADIASLDGALGKIRGIPALLVWGTRDPAILPSSAEPLARCFEHAEVRTIDGAGHLPYEEMPKEFNRMTAEFLVSSFE